MGVTRCKAFDHVKSVGQRGKTRIPGTRDIRDGVAEDCNEFL